MSEAERGGNVQVELVLPMEHEEGPVQGVSPELSVSPAKVDFVEETSLSILQDLVGQGSGVGEPELEWGPIQGVFGDA